MPKLLWREPVLTTTIRSGPAVGIEPPDPGEPGAAPTVNRVIALGDVAGRESGGLVVLLVAVGALTLASNDFLTGSNLSNLARQVAIFGIIAVGQLLVILTAGIDLSVGSVLALSGAVTAQLLVAGWPIPLAILVGVALGTGLGIVNGLLVTKAKLPPFIATLGMLGIARGVVLVITDAKTVQPLPTSFEKIANGTQIGIPNLLIFAVIITVAIHFVLTRTVFGRYIYAVGSNPESARLAGVPVRVVTVSVYAISGSAGRHRRLPAHVPPGRGHPHRRHRLRAQRHRRLRDRRGQPVRGQGQRHGRGHGGVDHGGAQQRWQSLGHQRLLPADRHRCPHPGGRRVRPAEHPEVGRPLTGLLGGIELGGTKVICVVGTSPGDVLALDRHPTTMPDETLGWAVARLRALAEEHGPLAAVGVAAFGPVDLRPEASTYGCLLETPKRAWVGVDVLAPVRAAFPGVPVGIGSDVDGAALAEGATGAARGLRDFLYVTIGTGIGMGVVVDGVLVHGVLHPEMGHVTVPRVDGDSYAGACFAHGDCLEGMASGTAMTGRWGQRPEELAGERREAALDLEAAYLAAGLRNAVYAFAPERIVLGGGVAHMSGLVERVRRALAADLGGYPGLPEYARRDFVVTAGLGDIAGPAGALEFAAQAAASAASGS